MSSRTDTLPEPSLALSKQEPVTIRDKIVHLFQELEGAKDEQRRVNTELENEIQARMEAEIDAAHLRRQVQLVEVNLDNTTNRVNHFSTQLNEIVQVSEAARHMCHDLENKSIIIKDKEIDLDDELRKAKECSIETDKHLQENISKLTELQEKIEHTEQRSIVAEQKIATLEQDIRHGYKEMKALIQAEEKTHTKEDKYRTDIEDLQSRLQSAQQRTDNAETEVGKLQLKVDKLKEKLLDERNKCRQLEKMIHASSTG